MLCNISNHLFTCNSELSGDTKCKSRGVDSISLKKKILLFSKFFQIKFKEFSFSRLLIIQHSSIILNFYHSLCLSTVFSIFIFSFLLLFFLLFLGVFSSVLFRAFDGFRPIWILCEGLYSKVKKTEKKNDFIFDLEGSERKKEKL